MRSILIQHNSETGSFSLVTSFAILIVSFFSISLLDHFDLSISSDLVFFRNPHNDVDMTSSTDFEDSLLPIADALAFVEQDVSLTFDLFALLLPIFVFQSLDFSCEIR